MKTISRSALIEQELLMNPKADTAYIATKLSVPKQLVYQARNKLKYSNQVKSKPSPETVERTKKAILTKSENTKSLVAYLVDLLKSNPNGLDAIQLANEALNAGYITRSTTFLAAVRRRLLTLVEGGIIKKTGKKYVMSKNTDFERQEIVKTPLSSLTVEESKRVKTSEEILETLDILQDLTQFCKRVGSIDTVLEYLKVLRQLQQTENR